MSEYVGGVLLAIGFVLFLIGYVISEKKKGDIRPFWAILCDDREEANFVWKCEEKERNNLKYTWGTLTPAQKEQVSNNTFFSEDTLKTCLYSVEADGYVNIEW